MMRIRLCDVEVTGPESTGFFTSPHDLSECLERGFQGATESDVRCHLKQVEFDLGVISSETFQSEFSLRLTKAAVMLRQRILRLISESPQRSEIWRPTSLADTNYRQLPADLQDLLADPSRPVTTSSAHGVAAQVLNQLEAHPELGADSTLKVVAEASPVEQVWYVRELQRLLDRICSYHGLPGGEKIPNAGVKLSPAENRELWLCMGLAGHAPGHTTSPPELARLYQHQYQQPLSDSLLQRVHLASGLCGDIGLGLKALMAAQPNVGMTSGSEQPKSNSVIEMIAGELLLHVTESSGPNVSEEWLEDAAALISLATRHPECLGSLQLCRASFLAAENRELPKWLSSFVNGLITNTRIRAKSPGTTGISQETSAESTVKPTVKLPHTRETPGLGAEPGSLYFRGVLQHLASLQADSFDSTLTPGNKSVPELSAESNSDEPGAIADIAAARLSAFEERHQLIISQLASISRQTRDETGSEAPRLYPCAEIFSLLKVIQNPNNLYAGLRQLGYLNPATRTLVLSELPSSFLPLLDQCDLSSTHQMANAYLKHFGTPATVREMNIFNTISNEHHSIPARDDRNQADKGHFTLLGEEGFHTANAERLKHDLETYRDTLEPGFSRLFELLRQQGMTRVTIRDVAESYRETYATAMPENLVNLVSLCLQPPTASNGVHPGSPLQTVDMEPYQPSRTNSRMDEDLRRTVLQTCLNRICRTGTFTEDIHEKVVMNAGIICSWVLWQRYFDGWGWLNEQGDFGDEYHRQLAANWLLRLAGGERRTLPLVELVTGLDFGHFLLLEKTRLESAMTITMKESIEELERMLLALWPVLREDQTDELSLFFLERPGVLTPTEIGWKLQMVTKPFDQLNAVNPLPWPLSCILLPWTTTHLEVLWF